VDQIIHCRDIMGFIKQWPSWILAILKFSKCWTVTEVNPADCEIGPPVLLKTMENY